MHYRIKRKKSLLDLSGPCRVAVVSDVHESMLASGDGPLRELIDRQRPEAIFCCGDMVTAAAKKAETEQALSLLRYLAERYPVYAVNGNHETRMQRRTDKYGTECLSYFREAEEAGVVMLNNRSMEIRLAGAKVLLAGFEADLKYYVRSKPCTMDASLVREALGPSGGDLYTILLAHHPDYFDAYIRWGADLVLSGHIHGGLVRFPFLGGVIGASFSPFPAYDRGRFRGSAAEGPDMDGIRWKYPCRRGSLLSKSGYETEKRMPGRGEENGETRRRKDEGSRGEKNGETRRGRVAHSADCEMIVSAGIGEHTLPLRWNNIPELVILDFD